MKTKRILSLILTVSIVVTNFPLIVQAGEQIEETFTQIEKIEDKMQTAPKPAEITEHFDIDSKDKFIEFMTIDKYHTNNCETTLLCDIDMEGAALKPISSYSGTFKGNGHAISNMAFINCCFAIDNYGTISGIGFRGCQQVSVDGSADAASFVINNKRNGMINDCFTENDIINQRGNCVGGFVGWNYGTITGCAATGEVAGNYNVGGFVGYNRADGQINNCTAEGEVTDGIEVGGFVGTNDGTITKCTAKGKVTGNEYVGGFVGWNDRTITNCTAKGEVTGNRDVGGFVGKNVDGTITGCTAEGEVTGNKEVGGFVGMNQETITECTATGKVNGGKKVGGFVGYNKRYNNYIFGRIINCTAIGEVTGHDEEVTGHDKVGGFVGWNDGTITGCTATGKVTGNNKVGGFVGNNGGTITNCNVTVNATGNVTGNCNIGGFVGFNQGTITNCNVTVNLTRNVTGNGKVLDKKKVVKGTITGILLAGAAGGVALGTIGFDKVENTLKNAWDNAKTFFNEKVMSNSDYKKVIGALIAFGIAAIIIIPIVKEEFRKRDHIDIPIGGFVGYNCGKIENCKSNGNVTVERVSMRIAVGGFVGINEVTGTITNCEAEEYVHANTKLSGKAGGFVGDNNGRIYKSKFSGERVYLSTGTLYKDDCCGGFAGKNSAGGVIDWCEVGEVTAESVGNGKKVWKGITTVETTNKTKGGGLVGVAGKLSITINCTCNARRQANIGKVRVKVCYKIEKRAAVTNCFAK